MIIARVFLGFWSLKALCSVVLYQNQVLTQFQTQEQEQQNTDYRLHSEEICFSQLNCSYPIIAIAYMYIIYMHHAHYPCY